MAETPMVERAARAICKAEGIDPDFRDEILSARGGCPQWRYEIDAARAAIGAMRMTHLPGDSMDIINAKRAWNAGIDAALAAPDEERET